VEIFGTGELGRQLETVLCEKGRTAFEVKPSARSAVGAMTFPVEAGILGLHDDVARHEGDGVYLILYKPTRSLVQSQLIGRVGRRSRIGHGLDGRMRKKHNRHASLASQPIERGKKIAPPSIGNDIAFAVAGRFDRRPAIAFADSRPD